MDDEGEPRRAPRCCCCARWTVRQARSALCRRTVPPCRAVCVVSLLLAVTRCDAWVRAQRRERMAGLRDRASLSSRAQTHTAAPLRRRRTDAGTVRAGTRAASAGARDDATTADMQRTHRTAPKSHAAAARRRACLQPRLSDRSTHSCIALLVPRVQLVLLSPCPQSAAAAAALAAASAAACAPQARTLLCRRRRTRNPRRRRDTRASSREAASEWRTARCSQPRTRSTAR